MASRAQLFFITPFTRVHTVGAVQQWRTEHAAHTAPPVVSTRRTPFLALSTARWTHWMMIGLPAAAAAHTHCESTSFTFARLLSSSGSSTARDTRDGHRQLHASSMPSMAASHRPLLVLSPAVSFASLSQPSSGVGVGANDPWSRSTYGLCDLIVRAARSSIWLLAVSSPSRCSALFAEVGQKGRSVWTTRLDNGAWITAREELLHVCGLASVAMQCLESCHCWQSDRVWAEGQI